MFRLKIHAFFLTIYNRLGVWLLSEFNGCVASLSVELWQLMVFCQIEWAMFMTNWMRQVQIRLLLGRQKSMVLKRVFSDTFKTICRDAYWCCFLPLFEVDNPYFQLQKWKWRATNPLSESSFRTRYKNLVLMKPSFYKTGWDDGGIATPPKS